MSVNHNGYGAFERLVNEHINDFLLALTGMVANSRQPRKERRVILGKWEAG
jgi:hypothetical protein